MAKFPYGNHEEERKVRGVAFDRTQLSAEEAAGAESPKTPRPKVQAAGIGGAVATLIVFIVGVLGVEVPPEAAAALATIAAFALGYRVPE